MTDWTNGRDQVHDRVKALVCQGKTRDHNSWLAMDDIRDRLAIKLDEMELVPADPEVDSALRLLKAFLKIKNETTRIAIVRLVESLTRH